MAHWLLYTGATADRLSGSGLKPLPIRQSAVAYASVSLSQPLSERRSAVAYVYFGLTCVSVNLKPTSLSIFLVLAFFLGMRDYVYRFIKCITLFVSNI